MGTPLSGPGIGLPLPQYLYPSQLYQAPYDWSNNKITLAGGDALPIPAGDWYIDVGEVSILQFADPVTGIWLPFPAQRGQLNFVKSDGFNLRIANLTGCPVAAKVIAGGTGYVQASTSVVPSTGNSTWQAVVGGMLSVGTISNPGLGYGVAPILAISAPSPGGVQATGHCVITAGTLSGVTLDNVGAGYGSAPVATILTNPTDPNINSGITQATVVIALNNSTTLASAISAVLCTNPGAPTASLPTLTVAGTGTGASVNAVTISTLLGATITGVGAGYEANGTELQTAGGQPAGVSAYVNPSIELANYRPRKASADLVAASTLTSLGPIYDSGLFAGTPFAVIATAGAPTAAATIVLTTGTKVDTVVLQPAP